MKAAGNAIFVDGKPVKTRGTAAAQWYHDCVQSFSTMVISDDNIYSMLEERFLTAEIGDSLEDYDDDVKNACESTFFKVPLNGDECHCMVCNKLIQWDKSSPFTKTMDPHRRSKDHREVGASRNY